MYNEYLSFVANINDNNIKSINFKSNNEYNHILEHVSYEQGKQYLNLIENEFSYISYKNILEFININDKYGIPNKFHFEYKNGEMLYCSPTSLRYIYHSLIILNYFKETKLKSMVEIGCGYGGLFIAICYFSKVLNIEINNYHLIDFPYVCNLIKNYIKINENELENKINFVLHDCNNYKNTCLENDLFLISNYCFSEITDENRNNYIEHLFDKIKNGFIIWQTVFGLDINKTVIIKKSIQQIVEEKPQTASVEKKNYFVYF